MFAKKLDIFPRDRLRHVGKIALGLDAVRGRDRTTHISRHPRDTLKLAEKVSPLRIRNVLQHLECQHEIELAVAKWQGLSPIDENNVGVAELLDIRADHASTRVQK